MSAFHRIRRARLPLDWARGRQSWSTLALLAVASFVVEARQSPREAMLPPTGTATIAGTVVTDDEPSRPIARAIVTLKGAELRPDLTLIADDAGRFVFSALPAGHFTVTASKPPYLTMSYGQTVAGRGSGLPIALADGQQRTGLVLKLPPGAVITGRVVDERGQPMRNLTVVIEERRTVNGERKLVPVGASGRTDSNGTYRAYGFAPGDYYMCAFPPGDFLVEDPAISPPASLAVQQIGPAELQWAQQQLRGSGATLGASPPPPAPPAGPVVAYGAVYYPGTPDPDRAAVVTLKRGEEKIGIDIPMSFQQTAKIEGRVVGPDGQPAINVRVALMIGSSSGGTTLPTGAIAYRNLLPGRYTILAQAVNNSLWAQQEIALNGRDVSDLVMTLEPALTLSGRVVFDATTLTPPGDLTAVRVTLVSPGHGLPTQIPVKADGSFQVASVVPGRYRLTASPYAAGRAQGPGAPAWTVKSMMVKNHDVADAFFEIGAGDTLADTVVTFSDRLTELSGKLMDAAGKAAAGYYVAVFSEDKAYWIQGGRRLPAPVRSATDGTFRFTGLPPGTYRLAALTEVDPSSLGDEAFWQQLVPSSIAITLAEGETKVQDLRIGGSEEMGKRGSGGMW